MKKKCLQTRTNKACPQAMVMFTGNGDGAFLHGLDFFKKCDLLDRNIFILKDPYTRLYMDGIGDGLDSFASLLSHLQSEIEKAPWITDVYCHGSSSGGVAALLAGHHLKAKEVWSMYPTWNYGFFRCRAMGKHRIPRRINPVRLLKNSQGHTRYNIYFHKGHQRDSRVAHSFAQIPGVVLHPLEGTTHNVYSSLESQDLLETLFPEKIITTEEN